VATVVNRPPAPHEEAHAEQPPDGLILELADPFRVARGWVQSPAGNTAALHTVCDPHNYMQAFIYARPMVF
jgi:hypothetical protein